MRNMKIKWPQMLTAMVILAASTFCLDGARRLIFKPDRKEIPISEEGTFLHDGKIEVFPKNGGKKKVENGYITEIRSSAEISQGFLALSTAVNPSAAVSLQGVAYLGEVKNEYYEIMDNTAVLTQEAAAALNRLMADYCAATSLNDFIVCGTTNTYTGPGGVIPKTYPDSAAGNSVDLAVRWGSEILPYDGCDAESWLIENCHDYGYIVRYPQGKEELTGEEYSPWHLTYVGQPHAAAMKKLNMCLEEYISALGKLNGSHFNFTVGIDNYDVYYVPTFGESTEIKVPEGKDYFVSGDNSGGFIITAKK